MPLIQALGVWGQRWTRRELAEHEIDLGLLLWTLERSAGPDAFGPGRSVVHLTLTDQPAHKAQWWFVNEDGACQLCIDDPGWEVDLYLACTLPDMIRIVRGDLKLVTALDSGLLEALGSRKAQGALGRWLNLSPLAQVESQRPT